MRPDRPIHHLARQLHRAAQFSKLKRTYDDALLVSLADDTTVAIYLFEHCPSPQEVGHILTKNSSNGIYTLPALCGDVFHPENKNISHTLAMLEIFYPHKTYAYKVLEQMLYILPVHLQWPDEAFAYYFAPPVDLLNLTVRTVDTGNMHALVADFGPRAPYDPQERIRQWQKRYGNGDRGRRTHRRRLRHQRRSYAARHYYSVLELDSSATFDDIRFAYRRLARQFHPDVNNSPEAREQMQKINEAYSVLVKTNYILRK